MSLSPAGTGIGQPVRRREDLRLLTGQGRYDFALEGTTGMISMCQW